MPRGGTSGFARRLDGDVLGVWRDGGRQGTALRLEREGRGEREAANGAGARRVGGAAARSGGGRTPSRHRAAVPATAGVAGTRLAVRTRCRSRSNPSPAAESPGWRSPRRASRRQTRLTSGATTGEGSRTGANDRGADPNGPAPRGIDRRSISFRRPGACPGTCRYPNSRTRSYPPRSSGPRPRPRREPAWSCPNPS